MSRFPVFRLTFIDSLSTIKTSSYMTDGFRGFTAGECRSCVPTVWAIQFEAELSFFVFSHQKIFLTRGVYYEKNQSALRK